MLASTFTILLASLGTASPLSLRGPPKTSQSKAFRLVVKLSNLSRDFTPPIENTYVNSIHTGAGFARTGVGAKTESRIFYQNGTADQERYNQADLISDGGTPPTPQPFVFTKDDNSTTLNDVWMNFGGGTPGVQLSQFPEQKSFLKPQQYLACNTSLAYYAGEYFVTIEQASDVAPAHVPYHCVGIDLVPECAVLDTLPKGSYSSHEFALESRCYADVSSLDWS